MATQNETAYTQSSQRANATASAWVNHYLPGVKAQGHVLDLAAGRGRHTRHALSLGFSVTAIDRDISGLGDLAGQSNLSLQAYDLEAGGPFPTAPNTFDGVIVTNYLWRPILPDIIAAVDPQEGVLIYETFGLGNEAYGRPKNPDFLLKPGELCDAVSGQLTVFSYQHIILEAPDRPKRVVSRICAAGSKHFWHQNPPRPFQP